MVRKKNFGNHDLSNGAFLVTIGNDRVWWLRTAKVLIKQSLSFITYQAKKETKNVCVVWSMGRAEEQ